MPGQRSHSVSGIEFPYGNHDRLTLYARTRKTHGILKLLFGNINRGFYASIIGRFGSVY